MFAPQAPSAVALALALGVLALTGSAEALPTSCVPPLAPYVPSDPRDVQDYADLIGEDFEAYFSDLSAYLTCLDAERARAFREAQEVTAGYDRFLQLVRRLGPPSE